MFREDFIRPLNPALVIINAANLYVDSEFQGVAIGHNSIRHPMWQLPMNGWIKLNVDGAVSASLNRARCGGVVRDAAGQWVAGFSTALGCCEAYEAEEWALLKGLELVWQLGFRKVILESDAKEVIDVLLQCRREDSGSLMNMHIQGRTYIGATVGRCRHKIYIICKIFIRVCVVRTDGKDS